MVHHLVKNTAFAVVLLIVAALSYRVVDEWKIHRTAQAAAVPAYTLPADRAPSAPASSHPATASPAPLTVAGHRTSCAHVAHVGDSTSVDLISSTMLPNPAQRLGAQYRSVGADPVIKAVGGTSVVEALPGTQNGAQLAKGIRASGFRGCWVFALGTNDAADIAAGSSTLAAMRIAEMMKIANGEPVLWVNVVTRLNHGQWSEQNMRAWNSALATEKRYDRNLKVYNWAAAAKPGWFLADGIHYTSAGCAARAHDIALALAAAYPAR